MGIRYLASNSFQIDIGDIFGVHQSSVSSVINNFLDALSAHSATFIKFPTDQQEIRKEQQIFFQKAGFPKVIGLIDGTHVRVIPSSEDEDSYVNRKGYHSVKVQATVDSDMRFTSIVARWPGRTHDSFVLRHSNLWRYFENKQDVNTIILGDSGYPNRNWLLTPFIEPFSEAEKRYNVAHRKTRVLVEQAFGVWKKRFSILHGENRLPLEKVPKTVICCAILHNMARNQKLAEVDERPPNERQNDPLFNDPPPAAYEGNCNAGTTFRRHFVLQNFE
jgi:hypothetical protein